MARGENLTLDLVQQDVYGLGAVLYYCLTGVPPHDGGDDHSLRIRIAGEEPVRSPRSLRPEIDPALEAICLAAIHPKPRLRYRSVEAFLGDLRDYLEGKPTYPPRETLWSWTQEFWRGHRWPLIAAASTLFCLLLTAVAWQAQAAAIESRTHRVRSLLSNLADPAPAQEPLRDQLLRVESDLRLLENAQEILSEGSVQPELVTDLAERLAILQQEQDRLKKNLEIERSEAAEVARQERFDRAVQEARFLAALPGPAKTFEGLNHRAAEETFARAFREEYGFVLSPNFDVERTAQELKQHANHRTIAAALLEWMMVRQNQQIEQIERAPWKAILGFQAEQRPIQKLRHLAEVMHRDSPWHRQMHLELANPFILPEKKFIALLDRPELDQIDIGSLLFIIAYITENNPEKGIAALRKILQRQRDNFWVHYYLARSYVHPQTLDLDQAVRHAEAALALHKDNPYALFSLANYLQARGNAEEAEPLLRTAIKARPSLSALLPRM
jgi:tetratricopeptide (TPR) repeat protein